LEQKHLVLEEDVWRGLDVLFGEIPIIWIEFESPVVESGSVHIDQIDDPGMLQEWNAGQLHILILVAQKIWFLIGSIWSP
jgi:hypothetical protein